MTKAMKEWITFEPLLLRFVLEPNAENSPLNLTSIHVTLSDGKNQSDYYFNIWVLKGEVSPPDPDPEPEPIPEPEPVEPVEPVEPEPQP